MKILDNINHTVREDLQDTMQKGSRVSIAAACFSIYAYQELKKQLEEIAELRFIFTSPTFVQENTPKERREFYIPKLTREKSLYGTEFEVRLRNELTQKALAKECADWVRRKVKFRSNVSGEQKFGLNTAEITGSVDGKTTIPKLSSDLNTVLTCFSPISKRRDSLPNANQADIDLLIATDCISEGQNLQDCDYLINYDIHWNPVRIIQRFGRIDRIGSQNRCIQLVNFWPDVDLDEYINLKGRVETRMKLTVMTSTGDDNLISPEEKGDLEYRSAQLKRLKNEVVDLEEMSGGISIMDLGLNEFRLDLLDYMKKHDDVEHTPLGMHAIVASTPDAPPGVIFVLKNINNEINVDQQNRLHPFYMVYIGQDGSTVCDYLSPKELLDRLRLLCKGKTEPDQSLCQQFNQATDDGKNKIVNFLDLAPDEAQVLYLLDEFTNSLKAISKTSDRNSAENDLAVR